MSATGREDRRDPKTFEPGFVERLMLMFRRPKGFRNVIALPADEQYTCPCCGHRTLKQRGGFEICDECGWEDDGQDDHDSDVVRGGPNGWLSLDMARAEYEAGGGIREPHTPPIEPI